MIGSFVWSNFKLLNTIVPHRSGHGHAANPQTCMVDPSVVFAACPRAILTAGCLCLAIGVEGYQ